MDTRLDVGVAGVEIDVSIQVARMYQDTDLLDGSWRADQYIRELWRNVERGSKKRVPPGSLRCTFVLEPMMADFRYQGSITTKLADTMGSAMRSSVLFSQLNVRAVMDEDHNPVARMAFGHFMNAVFGSARRSSEMEGSCDPPDETSQQNPNAFPAGTVHLKGNDGLELEAACSAIVTAQTTTKLSIRFAGYRGVHQINSEKGWKCLAYALFSKRARKYSFLKSLALFSIHHMSVIDIEAFGAILASDHPEEDLFGCHRGQVDEQDAALLANSRVRYESDEHGEFTTSEMTIASTIHLVRVFGDDETSEWVNVQVPGFGRCQVQRQQLSFHPEPLMARSSDVTSLTIGLDDPDNANYDGLPLFLQTIGHFLENLTIINMVIDLDVNTVLRSCPNLQELALHSGMIAIRLDFREFRKGVLPAIPNDWDETVVLIKLLSTVGDPFVNCVRRLRVFAINLSDHEDDQLDIDSILTDLLQMLDVNQTLEYLDVIAPKEHQHYLGQFRMHHLQPIFRSRGYELQSKLAFLSLQQPASDEAPPNKKHTAVVLARPALYALDRLALSNIFAFAAAPVLRQVYFREERRSDSLIEGDPAI